MTRHRIQNSPWLSLLALLAGTLATPSSARAEAGPEMFLTWHAPFGERGAKSQLTVKAGGAAGADTLYLSYRLPTDVEAFVGVMGVVTFHPQLDDTLKGPWGTDDKRPSFLTIEFPSDTGGVFRAAWQASGAGGWEYDRGRPSARVALISAIPSLFAEPASAGRTFCFARIIVRKEAMLQPLCVEWMESTFSFSINAPSELGTQSRHSFVSVNSPSGLSCAKYRLIAERERGLGLRRAQDKTNPAPEAAPADSVR